MNLLELRKKAKLTREELAKQVGCHKQQIYNFEKSAVMPPMKYVKKYAKAVGVSEKVIVEYIVHCKTQNLLRKYK